jgi:hypothetical protein
MTVKGTHVFYKNMCVCVCVCVCVCDEIYLYGRVGDRLSLSTSYTRVDCNDVYFGKNPTFLRNILVFLPSLELKRKRERNR